MKNDERISLLNTLPNDCQLSTQLASKTDPHFKPIDITSSRVFLTHPLHHPPLSRKIAVAIVALDAMEGAIKIGEQQL